MNTIKLIFLFLCLTVLGYSQSIPCVGASQMSSSCETVCLTCDLHMATGSLLDGSSEPGISFTNYCVSDPQNISYMSFIAGSTNLRFEATFYDCQMPDGSPSGSVQLGIFGTDDCGSFTSFSECQGYIANNSAFIYSNSKPLIIGQQYFIVMDGENGSICSWSIDVIEGNTGKQPTIIQEEICAGSCIEFDNTQICSTGTYTQTINTPGQCDELVILDLVVKNEIETFINLTLCQGEFYFIGSQSYNSTGQYEQALTTNNNCDSTVYLDLLIESCQLSGSTNSDPTICNGGLGGVVYFDIDQGSPPFQYQWKLISDDNIAGNDVTNLYTGNKIENLPAGTFQISVEDTQGDKVIFIETVEEPTPMSLDIELSNYNGYEVSCTYEFDGEITVKPSGGIPNYTYLWSNGQFSQEIRNNPTGIYTVLVTDSNGCQITESITLTAPEIVEPIVSFIDPTCEGLFTGKIHVTDVIGGVGPYQYSLVQGDYQSEPVFEELGTDFYNVFVVDANFCPGSAVGQLTAPEIPQLSLPSIIGFELGESTTLYPEVNDVFIDEISWSPSNGLDCNDCLEPEVSILKSQPYSLTVTSEDGCSAYAEISVIVQQEYDVYVPSIFSPNADGFNDIFYIGAGPEASIVNLLEIYDRLGNRLFVLDNFVPNDPNFGWDGIYKNKALQPGVYAYNMKMSFIDNTQKTYSGSITINY